MVLFEEYKKNCFVFWEIFVFFWFKNLNCFFLFDVNDFFVCIGYKEVYEFLEVKGKNNFIFDSLVNLNLLNMFIIFYVLIYYFYLFVIVCNCYFMLFCFKSFLYVFINFFVKVM